jgi:hypothetical protein
MNDLFDKARKKGNGKKQERWEKDKARQGNKVGNKSDKM